MTKTSFAKEKDLRKVRNSDVIRRMRNGDQLSSFNSYSSWYPPRPIIEKDPEAVKKLYGCGPRTLRNISLVQQQEERRSESRRLHLA